MKNWQEWKKQKTALKLNKPIFLGMSILDLSKVHMYSFYYDVLKTRYKDDIRLIYILTLTVMLYKHSLTTSMKIGKK